MDIDKNMKKIIQMVLPLLLLTSSALKAEHGECLEAAVYEMNQLHTTGCDCEDEIFKAVSTSMLAWGVGLFIGIALLTGLVHNSKGSTTTTTN